MRLEKRGKMRKESGRGQRPLSTWVSWHISAGQYCRMGPSRKLDRIEDAVFLVGDWWGMVR
jgi:hypothetical protein